MAKLIDSPARIEAAGDKPKLIEEFIGRVNSGTADLSIAHMRSPEGWQETEFDEYSLVLAGTLRVETKDGSFDAAAGQVVVAPKGEWVRYGTPFAGGAEYVAVCLPAFSPQTVHRDD